MSRAKLPSAPANPTADSPPLSEAPVEIPAALQAALTLSEPPPTIHVPPHALTSGTSEEQTIALRMRVAELEAHLASRAMRSESTPLPDSGPGVYQVMVRHSPVRKALKVVELHAENESDAWKKFVDMVKRTMTKPKEQTELAAWLARDEFDRTIRPVSAIPAPAPRVAW